MSQQFVCLLLLTICFILHQRLIFKRMLHGVSFIQRVKIDWYNISRFVLMFIGLMKNLDNKFGRKWHSPGALCKRAILDDAYIKFFLKASRIECSVVMR